MVWFELVGWDGAEGGFAMLGVGSWDGTNGYWEVVPGLLDLVVLQQTVGEWVK